MAAVCAAQWRRRWSNWSSAQSPALFNTSGRFGVSDDGSNAMTQQAALTDLGMQTGGVGGIGGFKLGLGYQDWEGCLAASTWRSWHS